MTKAIMETQLEIVCRQSDGPEPVNREDSESSNSVSSTQWLESTFQGILNKLRELARPDKQSQRNTDDDWEVPFERIRMFHHDFQRSGSQGLVFFGKLRNESVAVKQVKDVSLSKIGHLRELNHKNVIKFKGISANSSYYYIIMEWCPYGTLHEHIHGGRQLSSTILSNFAQQIANGMKYLHSRNIMHRDLKPSNILLSHNDVLKISDFGAHKLLRTHSTASCAGTPAYMAPEVIRGETHSFPCDVWSYGVVLWEILIREEPYKKLDSTAVLWAISNDEFRLPIPSSFPEGFSLILNGCWKAQPNERLTFQRICVILKCATHEVNKISKQRWLPLQDIWKKEARDHSKKHSPLKCDHDEDQVCRQRQQALDEALKANEQAQKRLNKNNDLYLKLQECCMHLQREREDLAREKEDISKIKSKMAHIEEESNRLKGQLSLITEELNRRGIQLDCL